MQSKIGHIFNIHEKKWGQSPFMTNKHICNSNSYLSLVHSLNICGVRSCFLLFAFTHKNAIYTNALDCGRPRSFYGWAGERGEISSLRGDIFLSFSSLP